MQKIATVYISQSIKQMRVTKLPNIRLGVSLSAGLLNLDLDVEGWIRRSFLIFFPGTIAGKIFPPEGWQLSGCFRWSAQELSALKNGLQISDRELKKERLRFRPIVLCIWTVS